MNDSSNTPRKLPLIRLLAGMVFLLIAIAVFGVRLQHAGAYAMPGTGALIGSFLPTVIQP